MVKKVHIGRCPACGKSVALSGKNVHRPFCSLRCRTTDLGKWAMGEYRIVGDPVSPTSNVEEMEEEEKKK